MTDLIAGRTLAEWQEFARRDDCLERMVPSDLRLLVGRILADGWEIERMAKAGPAFIGTHRHVKRGTIYAHLGTARIQSDEPLGDMDLVEVYIGEAGDLWARRQSEFYDGRFAALSLAAADAAQPAHEPRDVLVQDVAGRVTNMPLADMARAEAFRTLARCIHDPSLPRKMGLTDLSGVLAWEQRRIATLVATNPNHKQLPHANETPTNEHITGDVLTQGAERGAIDQDE